MFNHGDDYRLIVSPPLTVEFLDVLKRPEIARKFRFVAGLDQGAVRARLANATVVDPPEISPVSRDPKDDKLLATAKAGQADYLVSEDEDLLVLGEYEGTRIVNAATFLDILRHARPDSDLQSSVDD